VRLQAAIAAGGIAGALARAGLEHVWPASGHAWPWTTFAVNAAGTLLLGYFVTRLQERLPPSTYRRPFLGTGLCGALTTFSTLQIEALQLCRHGHVPLGVAYLAGTLAAGLAGMHLATAATRRVRLR
jgi:CrcB protein